MKHYTLKLTAVTPFHVGSDVKYSKKEYHVDTETQTVTLMDMNRVMGWIAEQGREALIGAFESFMMSRNDNDIRDFLTRRIRMPETVQKDCVLYSFRCGGAFSSDTNKRDLSAFMRDAEGRPYVPGSSLKGALRTALLYQMIAKEEPQRRQAAVSARAAPMLPSAAPRSGLSFEKPPPDTLWLATSSTAENSPMILTSDPCPVWQRSLVSYRHVIPILIDFK